MADKPAVSIKTQEQEVPFEEDIFNDLQQERDDGRTFENIEGRITTVTSTPTNTPRKIVEQIRVHNDGAGDEGIDIYDTENNTWIKVGSASGIDGDKLDIDWNPTNYTPDSSISEADDVDDLSAHLKGIDDELAASSSADLIVSDTNDVDVSSTAAETNLMSETITGGTLGTDGVIKGRVYFRGFQFLTGDFCVFRFKYGSTTIGNVTITNNSGNTLSAGGYAEFFLVGAGTTSSQEGHLLVHIFPNSSCEMARAASTTNEYNSAFCHDDGTATETSTGDLALAVTADFNDSSASNQVLSQHYYIEKLSS